MEKIKEELLRLEQRAEELRQTLQRFPFYRVYISNHLSPQEYGSTHTENLLARQEEIERGQEDLLNDPAFASFLCGYYQELFDLAVFEARALIFALQKPEQTEEKTKETPDEYRQRQARAAQVKFEDDIAADVEAIKQEIARKIRLVEFQKELEQEFSQHQDIVQETFRDYKRGDQANEQPPPRIY